MCCCSFSACTQDAKVAALAEFGLPASCAFPLRIDALPAGLINYAAFCSAGAPVPDSSSRGVRQVKSSRASQTSPLGSASDVRSLLSRVLPGAAQAHSGGNSTAAPGWSEQQPGPMEGAAAAARVAASAQQVALPPDLEAAGCRYVASTCAAMLKTFPAAPPAANAKTQALDTMLAGIVSQERRILARTEFMCSSRARAVTSR